MIDFFLAAASLKSVRRAGWAKAHVSNPESVADHSFLMALMAMTLGEEQNLDTSRLVGMALLHDLAESITGDITPDDARAGQKSELEEEAMRKILDTLPLGVREKYGRLWREYCLGESAEASFLYEIDKLEMALQASIYSDKYDDSFAPFIESARQAVKTPALAILLEKLVRSRP